jgi:hypothetical protein
LSKGSARGLLFLGDLENRKPFCIFLERERVMKTLRIKETVQPSVRPPYREWVREMGITGLAHINAPDGQPKARAIMKGVGVERIRTQFEFLFDIECH